jgi:hypothetical protein
MGRWAQRRLRATPSNSVGITPPTPLNVLAFFWDGGAAQYRCIFDGPITYVGVNTLTGVDVDGESVVTCTQVGVDGLMMTFPTATGPGTTWTISSQPAEIAEPIVVPQSGVTF